MRRALRRIPGDNERCLSDEAPQYFVKRCRHRRYRIDKRMMRMIEELNVKVLSTAFERDEEETGARLVGLRSKISGHRFEAGHTNRPRTGSERDPAHGCKSNADAGETAGPDRRSHGVEGCRRQS
jgi:hypothetical protein